ncbi:flagellar biosynthesis repressor FlbT [Mesorhizobium sp. A556]
MKNTLKLSLKPNEKLYVNGAVIRVDRKVTLELLNDVQFLLENHVLQPEQASTPLKQLYFILQVMLMNPQGAVDAREMVRRSLPLLLVTFQDEQVRSALKNIDRMVGEDRIYEALKAIRALYPIEHSLLSGSENPVLDDNRVRDDNSGRPMAVGAR